MSREIERAEMVETIQDEVAATRAYIRRDHLSPQVMAAMAEVPRHCFVPEAALGTAIDIAVVISPDSPYLVELDEL